jgi:hypothetical protein
MPPRSPPPDLSGPRLPPALALPDGRLLLPFPRRARGRLTYAEETALAAVLPMLRGPPAVPCWCCMITGTMTALGPTEPGWMARQAFDRAEVWL